MLRCVLVVVCCWMAELALAADAPDKASNRAPDKALAKAVMAATGTASALDSPAVQRALQDAGPFQGEAGAPRFERLLAEAGFKRWQPPRVWILQAHQGQKGDAPRWSNMTATLGDAGDAMERGLTLAMAEPSPEAEKTLAALVSGKPSAVPGKSAADFFRLDFSHVDLPGLLAANGADALALVQGRNWMVWHSQGVRQGRLPEGMSLDILPVLAAEAVAAIQQWPEARGRQVLQVVGPSRLADFAQAQAELQSAAGGQSVPLLRADGKNLWFALPEALESALMTKPGATPQFVASPDWMRALGLPARLIDARRLGCPLLVRRWAPENVPKPPVPAATPAIPPLQAPVSPMSPSARQALPASSR